MDVKRGLNSTAFFLAEGKILWLNALAWRVGRVCCISHFNRITMVMIIVYPDCKFSVDLCVLQ